MKTKLEIVSFMAIVIILQGLSYEHMGSLFKIEELIFIKNIAIYVLI